MANNLVAHSTATQLSIIHSTAIVSIAQTVLQAIAVTSGKVKAADISNKTTVTNKQVTIKISVVLKF